MEIDQPMKTSFSNKAFIMDTAGLECWCILHMGKYHVNLLLIGFQKQIFN